MQGQSEFGPYQLNHILKSGGMSVIYLASEKLLPGVERLVVLKRISPENRTDEQFVTMFFDEVRVLTGLSHPGLPYILAAGTIKGEPYFAMEYIDGISLSELLKDARSRRAVVPQREALYIALSLAETLAYIHQHRDGFGRPSQIVHRDIKPANVVISTSGAVKLIDFGIAQGVNRVYQTATGVVKGTLGYMAPEQLLDAQPLTHRVDVFCYGVLLYELLVGRQPFVAPDALKIYELISKGIYKPPRSMNSGVSIPMNALTCDCLSVSPADRPSDMWEVVSTLRDEMAAHKGLPLREDVARIVRRLKDANEEVTSPVAKLESRHKESPWTTEVDLRRPAHKRRRKPKG